MKTKLTYSVLMTMFFVFVLISLTSCDSSDSTDNPQPNPTTTSSFKAAFNTENGGLLETSNGANLNVSLGSVPSEKWFFG